MLRKRFLDEWSDTAGWTGTYAQRSRRVSQWFTEGDAHRLPVEALPALIRALGSAAFLDPLLALEAKLDRERRAQRHPAIRVDRRRESA